MDALIPGEVICILVACFLADWMAIRKRRRRRALLRAARRSIG
jgi:hypothetical protein